MIKLLRSQHLELTCVLGIDPDSEGLAMARVRGLQTSDRGLQYLLDRPNLARIVFDATTARSQVRHAKQLEKAGITCVDLTPAAVGPYVVPPVSLEQHYGLPNLNMTSCGGQATIPIVAAIAEVSLVKYAEIVSTIASRSAGPGTRQNIDEFTHTTARGLEIVGGAQKGKAIIILNPAEPPILMRNTVYALVEQWRPEEIERSITRMVKRVEQYVPKYRLRAQPILDENERKVTVLLEVEGAGDYLPTYAGNLDIMTAAAVQVGEMIAVRMMSASTAIQ
ncbi:MAG: acetaldehyde dehydrogenase (acetylating) [Acidobacteria bacterium]|nr:acetaldehyde dehydrogenase (acetylating) [Acidobacteriota bacterium]